MPERKSARKDQNITHPSEGTCLARRPPGTLQGSLQGVAGDAAPFDGLNTSRMDMCPGGDRRVSMTGADCGDERCAPGGNCPLQSRSGDTLPASTTFLGY